MAYTDPTGSGWRLLKDASSTPTRLVLNLVGPTGLMTRGLGLNLQLPASVKAGVFGNRLPINDLGVYDLLSAADDPSEPVALMGGIKGGNLLSVGIYQKSRDKAAKDSGAALCQVALEFDATAGLHVGDSMALSVVKAKAIPEDIGQVSDDIYVLNKKVRMADITIALGALTAQ
jgi:hypothetical protein